MKSPTNHPSNPIIYILSGGVGASGEQLVYTMLAQFPEGTIKVTTVGHVRNTGEITRTLEKAKKTGGLVVHTLVDDSLRRHLTNEAVEMGVPAIDLMGPLIEWVGNALGQKPLGQPGKYRQLHSEYFERVAAIDYTMAHDDGKNPEGWPQAEVVLVGVSRAGKTPLCLYLAILGWKAANVPLVPQVAVRESLFRLPPERVIGVTIDPEQLLIYRRQRQRRLGVGGSPEYTNPDAVRLEVQQALKIFRQGSFDVIDMTDKTIEMGADEIIRKLSQQKG